jgi:hypothetical protein
MRITGDDVEFTNRYVDDYISIPMSTAILRTLTEDGFLITADGLERSEGHTSDTKAQKIFSFPPTRFSFAFAGIADLPVSKGIFNFKDAWRDAVAAIPMGRHETMGQYATRIAIDVQRLLLEQCPLVTLPEHPSKDEPGSTITEVFIDGYRNGYPESADVRFFHINQQVASPRIFFCKLQKDGTFIHGSETITQLLKQKDPLIEQFKTPLQRAIRNSPALSMHAIIARAYIKACESAEGRSLDPVCESIGGRIHMATITSPRGFEWVREFEPVKPQP